MKPFATRRRIYELLLAPRAVAEDDARRELVINGLLVCSLLLAFVPAVQRMIQISQEGPGTADHVQTLVVLVLSGAGLGTLLSLSRRGRPIAAAWGLMAIFYAVTLWSALVEGPQKSFTILLSVLLVVAAGVVCGGRTVAFAAALAAVTLGAVTALQSTQVISGPTELSTGVPDAVTLWR